MISRESSRNAYTNTFSGPCTPKMKGIKAQTSHRDRKRSMSSNTFCKHKLIADQARIKMWGISIFYSQFHLSHAATVLLFLVNHPSLQSIDLSSESWAAASGSKRSSGAFDLHKTFTLILSFQFWIEQTKTSRRDTLGFDSSGSAKTTKSACVDGFVKWKPKKILQEIFKAEYSAECRGDLAIISIYLSNKPHHWNALSTYNSLQIFIYE